MVGYALSAMPHRPEWLEALLSEKFFSACGDHGALKKNERNIFCVDCNHSICQHCLPVHRSHRLLQIRRYVYHDVIRLLDVQKLVDCTQVQTYIINSARVVFLNQRPQPRPSKGLGNSCETCERSLQDTYRYCSVACKVDAFASQGKDSSALLHHYSSLPSPEIFNRYAAETLRTTKSDLEDELSPLSGLSDPHTNVSNRSMSDSSGTDAVGGGTATSTAATLPPVKKSRSNRPPVVAPPPKPVNPPFKHRRKGVPHRSPLQ